MSEEKKLNSSLNIMRRMPPATCENSLAGLIELAPDMTDALLNHVDQPLQVEKDEKTGKMFVLCDYNRDGDSYRSPWSNEYYPAIDDGFVPSDNLREMEKNANYLFDVYRKLYFDGGHSSVYFFNTEEKDEDGFGACFLIHKDVSEELDLQTGCWDSIHVFDVQKKDGNKYTYSLTTTVMIAMVIANDDVGEVNLSGSMAKQAEVTTKVDGDQHTHIANLGTMVEDIECNIRGTIEKIYIQKTREVINGIRSATGQRDKQWDNIAESLRDAISKHGKMRLKDSE